jgi:hypothetical protein
MDHRSLASAAGTIDEHIGEPSMFSDRLHDDAVGLFKQAMRNGGLLEPGFFLFRRKAEQF